MCMHLFHEQKEIPLPAGWWGLQAAQDPKREQALEPN